MSHPTCSNCYYYLEQYNQCKRHAPVPFLASVQPDGQGLVITAFPSPPLRAHDWCGEHMAMPQSTTNMLVPLTKQ